ncbi:hypothetical protein [Actinomadura hibisca]|uniref:hypothetical protein n=1 Tax=Actinomadura hibisca TaxID=68565 RepID=UPI000835C82B|nr:hypothetical protein [Actinomadura hibisca]
MKNPAHLDYDTLADLAEGLLEDDHAASVNAHLESCADCRDRSADLADVSRLLAEAPTPAMPADLASRIDSAIAAESLHSAQVVSLEQRRGRRHWRLLSAAAATAIVLGGGAMVGKAALEGSDGDASTAAKTPVMDGSDGGAAMRSSARAPGAATEGSGPRRDTLAAPVTFTVAASGTDYRASSLGPQVGDLLGKGGESRTEGRAPDARLSECVASVTRGKTPALVDSARYEGGPATVIAVRAAKPDAWEIWVVGPDCSAQDTRELKHTVAGG